MIAYILLISALAAWSSAQDIVLKAPSLRVNCNCQCDNYIFTDGYGVTQGNCRSSDYTGAKWCYVNAGSSCNDLRQSQRGGYRYISYEACATPNCGGGYGFGNGYGNGYGNGFGNGYGSGYGNSYGNGYSNGYGNSYSNGYDSSNSNGFGNSFGSNGYDSSNGYNYQGSSGYNQFKSGAIL